MTIEMNCKFVFAILVLLGVLQMHDAAKLAAGNPMSSWRPAAMPLNSPQLQPYSGIAQPYPMPQGDAKDDQILEKPDGFKPPAYPSQPPAYPSQLSAYPNFMPNYNAPSYQFPNANVYPGTFPQFQARPPKMNLDDAGDTKEKVEKPDHDDDDDKHDDDDKDDKESDDDAQNASTYKPNFSPGFYAPGFPYPYPGYFPAAQSQQQYYYPGSQPASPAYSPYYQGQGYGYPQPEQQYNDQPKVTPPPPPKIPELMSTLLQISKNRQRYGPLSDQQTCSSCNKCNQCYKSALCSQCDFCKDGLCDQAKASLPLIPKNLRPLWEQWNERTADMNSMEMSALILSPYKKVTRTKASSAKRSHIRKPKTAHTVKKSIKHSVKVSRKNSNKQ